MLYKGGPKNYSKGDWMVIKAIVGIVVVASIVAKIADPGSSGPESASTSVAASSEFVDAAKRAGYSDSDADQVAAAAERLCIATGECCIKKGSAVGAEPFRSDERSVGKECVSTCRSR